MDIFETKQLSPMLITELKEPFNNPNYIYELKLDGLRCLAYIDKNSVDLRNKRNKAMLDIVPELSSIYTQVKEKCILDGELLILRNGVPDFFEIQKRALMSNPFKIKLASNTYPASFVAYDILYIKDYKVIDLPIEERKRLLQGVVIENDRLAVSRVVEEKGIELFELAKSQQLEGVIAKRKGSTYMFGKRTKDWIKFKFLLDEDYVVCGYIPKENAMISLVLGLYDKSNQIVFKGHVTLGVTMSKLTQYDIKKTDQCPFSIAPKNHEDAIWLLPELVCIVQSMYSEKSGLRQPVLKGFRNDKLAHECIEKAEK